MTDNKRFTFTAARIEGLPNAPEGARDTYYDIEQPNLCLIVTDKGSKSFYVRRSVRGGGRFRQKLGTFPHMKLKDARQTARDKVTLLDKGENPRAEIDALLQQRTLGEVYGLYRDREAKRHKRSWRYEEDLFNRLVKGVLGKRRIGEVTKQDVRQLHANLTENNGPVAANRVLALLSVCFKWARDNGHFPEDKLAPVVGVKKNREQSRDRFLKADELKAFLAALDTLGNPDMKDYFLISLLTGARKSNVRAMRWNELELNGAAGAVWRIPTTKNGEPVHVVLVPKAVEILEARWEANKAAKVASQFVFAGAGKTGHIIEPKRSFVTALKAANMMDKKGKWLVEKVTLHDLRRTLGSWQAMTGASLPIIGKSLGHRSRRSTEVYSHLTLDPVRESMLKATNEMMKK